MTEIDALPTTAVASFDDASLELEEEDAESSLPNYMSDYRVKLSLFFCYAAVFLFGLFSNFAMLVVGIRHQILDARAAPSSKRGKDASKRQTFSVTNVLVTNLAAADIFLCAFSLFFTPLSFYVEDWPFGEFGCKFLPTTSIVSVCVISFTSTVIAFDRLLAICYPHSPRLTVKTALLCLFILWVVSSICSLPIAFHNGTVFDEDFNITKCNELWPSDMDRKAYSSIILSVQFVLPAIVIIVCYVKIGLQLRARSLQYSSTSMSRIVSMWLTVQQQTGTSLALPQRSNLAMVMEDRKTIRTIRILVSMVAIFMLCWLPINSLLLTADVSEENVWQTTSWYAPAYFCSHLLAMSCTLWNPLLYGWMNGNLRLKLKETFFPSVKKRRHSIATPLETIAHQTVLIERLLSNEYKLDEGDGDEAALRNDNAEIVEALHLTVQQETSLRESDTSTMALSTSSTKGATVTYATTENVESKKQ